MFRPCRAIFREKPSFVVTLGCTIQLSENVLLTVHCAVYGGVKKVHFLAHSRLTDSAT
jgi:hypothetical protein